MRPEPRYKKGDRIGSRYLVHKALLGGMGEVYLCLDLEEMEPYALKTFQQRYLTNHRRLRQAFEQEVATWVALEKHPNIVRCFYMNTLDHQPFMVLEWIASEEGKGTDLRSWLRRGPLELKLALEITIDICNGLLHAQAKQPGLVHRDLKPDNILMAQGGLAKITDFGLAQILAMAGLELDQESRADNRQSLVGKGGIAGTPAYMAPEQWRGEALDERTDIYAIGCILYELLTGILPFTVNFTPITPRKIQRWMSAMHVVHESSPYPKLPAALTAALDEILQRCLAKTQSERPSCLAELTRQLTQLYQQQFGQSPPRRPAPDAFTAIDYNNRGQTYNSLQRYEQALADFDHALELDPNDTVVYVNRGQTYAQLQRYEQALTDFDHALELDPNDAIAYHDRGTTYVQLERYEQALADFNHALELDPNFTLAYGNRGQTYDALQRYEQALADFDHVLELDPNFAKAYNNRGITYDALQRDEEALADFNHALELDPNSAPAYGNRGRTHFVLQHYEQALADFDHALELDPNLAPAYYDRGRTHFALQHYEQALADFDHALELDPNLAPAYYDRGRTYFALQRYEQALADFDRALELDFNDALVYYDRGRTYFALQRYEQALADFDHTLELDFNDALVYYKRGGTYQALQRYEQALADFDRALALDPNDVHAYNNRGLTYQALQCYEQALADYTRALALDSNDVYAYVNIGALLGNQGKLAEALPYFEQAARLGDATGAQYAAQARRMLGRE